MGCVSMHTGLEQKLESNFGMSQSRRGFAVRRETVFEFRTGNF
jgi:hypothetical protein